MTNETFQTLVGDIETQRIGEPDDPLPKVVHSLVLHEVETGRDFSFAKKEVETGVRMLERANAVVFHNGIDFDIEVLKVSHDLKLTEATIVYDTFVLASLFEADIAERMDYDRIQNEEAHPDKRGEKFPRNLVGSHQLAAWGARLGMPKDDYAARMEAKGLDPWEKWSPLMQEYCDRDVKATVALWKHLQQYVTDPANETAIRVEHRIAYIMSQLRRHGVFFDKEHAGRLLQDIRDKIPEVEAAIEAAFPPIYEPSKWTPTEFKTAKDMKLAKASPQYSAWQRRMVRDYHPYKDLWGKIEEVGEVFIPKRTMAVPNSPDTRVKNAAYCKIERREIKPTSRPQIARRLKRLGWKPTEFTEAGNPVVDDTVLTRLSDIYPQAAELARYFTIDKRLGQIDTGKEAWTRRVCRDGRIHPRINPCATITHRPSHSSPNLSQVPAPKFQKTSEGTQALKGEPGGWGYECRQCFIPPPPERVRGEKWVEVGIDLSGLELRCFGHALFPYDNGQFLHTLATTDIHARNQQIMGLANRTDAKRVIFACVPMDTQALTRRGWKTYSELVVGEDILTYNAETKTKEWQPLLEKVHYDEAPIVRMQVGKGFDVRCTSNHRWFVKRRTGRKTHYYVDEVREASEMNTECKIITNAPMACKEDTTSYAYNWLVDGKYEQDWVAYVLHCSQDERRAFLAGFCIADGYSSKKDTTRWQFAQNDGNLHEAALLAAYLVHDGNVNVIDKKNGYYNRKDGRENPAMKITLMAATSGVTCQTGKFESTESGVEPVWCPRTANGSWIMRQGDTITITGNTLYGAGDEKIGSIVFPLLTPFKQKIKGREIRSRLMEGVHGFSTLTGRVKKDAARRGALESIDGRKLPVRREYAALNTLLQGMGAVLAKHWVVNTYDAFLQAGFKPGYDRDFVMWLWSHDEIQFFCREEDSVRLAEIAKQAALDTGKSLDFKIELESEYMIGANWAECH